MIHPTAIIEATAKLDPTVDVGPYTVIDGSVSLGPHCIIGPHVYLTGNTSLGSHNVVHAGCVIGDAPQDLKYKGEPTRLRVGDHNIFREHVTIHRSNKLAEETVIGSHNFFIAQSHVGHNSRIGNHVVVANSALLAGHVVVNDRAFISGSCLVHQFVRVGTLSLMQGGAAISKDLPPYTVAHRVNTICGLNSVGLRRAGFTVQQRLELKRLYHLLFRNERNLREAVAAARMEFMSESARVLLDFIAESQRGVCSHPHSDFTEDS